MTTYRKNPFTISFGRLPAEYIARSEQMEKVIATFTEPPVTDQIFVITGIRGTGKTVLFSDITNRFAKRDDWIVIHLSTDGDMIGTFYSDLFHSQKLHNFLIQAGISIPGIRVSVTPDEPAKTDKFKIEELLRLAQKHGKNILVAVDEVSKTPGMQKFAKLFQEMIGKNLPLYFLGTGIFENIEELQNVKDLTFLYRAPRIVLGPLDPTDITQMYQKVLDIPVLQAAAMAKLTKGYCFAFQALGYSYWEQKPVSDLSDILPQYDNLLSRASYSKLWKKMSDGDRKVCRAIASKEGDRVREIRSGIHMDSGLFNVYRRRLKEKGLIDTNTYGRLSFTLPRFAEFVNTRADLYV